MGTSKVEARLLPLESIEWRDTDSQLRIDQSPEYVDSLAEILTEADEHARSTHNPADGPVIFDHPFPEIVLFTDGGLSSRFYIGDGYNRYHAHRKAGRDAIRAKVHVVEDPRFEAFRCALSANSKHGRPRTQADKRNAVRQALACEKLHGLTLREYAAICDVSKNLVHTLQRENLVLKDKENPIRNLPQVEEPDAPKVESTEPQDRPTTRVSTPRDHDPPRITDATIPLEPEQPTGPQDKLKREVPSGLIPHWQFGKELAELKRYINAAVTKLEGFVTAEGPPPGSGHLHVQTVFAGLKMATDELGNAAYHTECPECDLGKVNGAKCKTCSGEGFLTASMYERLPPKSKEKLSA